MTGPSRAIDHRLNAARRDLADIALAGRWFAPHYSVPQSRTCGVAGADILSAPNGERISQLLAGERFAVVEQSGDWAWGYSLHDHYVGYVRAAALNDLAEATHVVEGRAAILFAEPSSHSAVREVLPTGVRLHGEVHGDFLRTGDGYVPARLLRPIANGGGDPVAVAERLVGTPYLWGGRGIGGIDCSGLVQIAYATAGIALPRDSDQQITEGDEVSGDVRRGDLLFFPHHVVAMSAPDRAIHASGYWMAVVEEPLDAIVERLGQPTARRRVLP